MANKVIMDKISIYVPQSKIDQKLVERLITLGKKEDRSINYLVVESIIQYLDLKDKKQ